MLLDTIAVIFKISTPIMTLYLRGVGEGRRPDYLRFAPGANYLVPREHVLIRSRAFYINLKEFVAHSRNSCESHFVERSLMAIWSSGLKESASMSRVLTVQELDVLARGCVERVSKEMRIADRFRRGAMIRMSALARFLFG